MVAFPFSAVVGMDDLRLALILNAVSPSVGGVLVRGEKGTAKSTMVRALAAVLPDVPVADGCRFSCDPGAPDPHCPDGPHAETGDSATRTRPARLVELPVGASEDRVTGSLDVERALTEGVKAYEPGLLAAAHRGVLYVDEVNLLHDHLVDLLLDAAALGRCYVEREGVSVQHAARFILVGTMNPEEGELRPQLLDRFGLTVDVSAPDDQTTRAEVVRRRLAFEADPETFCADWKNEQQALAERISRARVHVSDVKLPDAALTQITAICAAFGVQGLRADLVTARAAIAHAAWCARDEVADDDIRAAAALALPHRRRRDPFDSPGLDAEQLDDVLDETLGSETPVDPPATSGDSRAIDHSLPDVASEATPASGESRAIDHSSPDVTRGGGPEGDGPDDDGPGAGGPGDGGPGSSRPPANQAAAPSAPFRARRLEVPGLGSGAAGRRSRAETTTGKVMGARVPGGAVAGLHLTATVRAAAPYQRQRGRDGSAGLILRRDDLRVARREGREQNLVLFVVDASGSMAARQRMSAVKGAVLSLLLDAYQRRDKVGLITFAGDDAHVVLPPTSSVDAAATRLSDLPTGGRTPLAAGLTRAADVLRVEHLRDAQRRPLLMVLTDGRATGRRDHDALADAHQAAAALGRTGVASIVVDCESGPVRLGLARALAKVLDGDVLRLEELAADTLAESVRTHRRAA